MINGTTNRNNDTRSYKLPPWWQTVPLIALLPVTILPFALLLAWELTERPIRALTRGFLKTDWKKVGRVGALVGQDAANSRLGRIVQRPFRHPIAKTLGREIAETGRELGRSVKSFYNACRKSGPWGGAPAAGTFFTAIVGLSVAATVIKVPLLAYHFFDFPQLAIDGTTWLINRSPAVVNFVLIEPINALTHPLKIYGVRCHLHHLTNLALNPFQIEEHFPRIGNVLAKGKPADWWQFGRIPYVGPYLEPVIGTKEIALSSAIKLAIAAKLVKPVVAPLYILFPQMKERKSYKAAMGIVHALGYAVYYSMKTVVWPVKAIGSLYRRTPTYRWSKAGWHAMGKGAHITIHALKALHRRLLGPNKQMGLAEFLRTNVHGYFLKKAEQVGGIEKVHKDKIKEPARTFSGDIAYVLSNPRQVAQNAYQYSWDATPTLGTFAAVYGSILTYAKMEVVAARLPDIAGANLLPTVAAAAFVYAGTSVTRRLRGHIAPAPSVSRSAKLASGKSHDNPLDRRMYHTLAMPGPFAARARHSRLGLRSSQPH